MIALYVLCFLSLFFGHSWARWLARSSALALVLTILLKLFPPFERDLLKVSVLDVGQGDAILLELPGRRTILVDGGGLSYGDFDIGEKAVAPYLRHRWIRKLDVVILSHPHSDHLDGLRAVFQEFPVGELWEAGYPSFSPIHLFIGEFARLRGIPHRIIQAGFVSQAFAPVTLSVLHPAQPFLQGSPRGSFSDTNSNSIVLKVAYDKI
jgi:competence protein ComEC